jgi:hypothetical protein
MGEQYITERVSLKSAYPNMCKGEDDSREFIRKGLVPSVIEDGTEERTIISYITTLALDRDMEVILPSGIDVSDYMKNNVVMWGHDYWSLPIGKNLWMKTDDKGIRAATKYAETEKANEIYKYRKDGFPLAESIGFIPIEWVTPNDDEWDVVLNDWRKAHIAAFGDERPIKKHPRRIYTKVNLLEYSDVPIPSNPEAITLAISKGLLSKKEAGVDDTQTDDIAKLINRIDELENKIKELEKAEEKMDDIELDETDKENIEKAYDGINVDDVLLNMFSKIADNINIDKAVDETILKANGKVVAG